MSGDNLPSMGEIQAARASQQARTASVKDLIEMKKQARQIALEILVQASSVASTGIAPLPDVIVDTIAEKLMDHAVGFLSGLADAG